MSVPSYGMAHWPIVSETLDSVLLTIICENYLWRYVAPSQVIGHLEIGITLIMYVYDSEEGEQKEERKKYQGYTNKTQEGKILATKKEEGGSKCIMEVSQRALRGKIEEESSKKLDVHVMEGCGGRRVLYIFICLFLRCIVMTSIISIIFSNQQRRKIKIPPPVA